MGTAPDEEQEVKALGIREAPTRIAGLDNRDCAIRGDEE